MAIKKNQYSAPIVFHPGETLTEKLVEMGMGPKEFAIRTGKPEKTIIAVIKGDSALTPDMAVQFESVTGIPAHFWMNSQRSYDEYMAREKRKEMIAQSVEWAKLFPVADMMKKGWLPATSSIEERISALLSFFGVSSPAAWEDYYFNQELKVAFRISLAHTSEPYAISAWLRKGELQAAALPTNNYSEKSFREILLKIKRLMAKQPADFFNQLQSICLKVGVKVVYTPCLPKAPINGSTRWLNDTPFIQLAGRYKRNDAFWFTFFHEAGHILLHGKKDVFLENIEYPDKMNVKELDADAFAVKWTLSEDEEKEILTETSLDEKKIRIFARKFNTHPAIIIGRLQHKGLIPYTLGREMVETISL
ncbi:MAG: HigA family addiction module antitoxin [Paludibacter sp.]|nr:HigA family addiction module antitoxin [Paludibacter sp.]